jgi:magnesium chelatase family protein
MSQENFKKGMYCNADMQSKEIQRYCKLDAAGEELLKMAINKLGLSARAYDWILKVGRTITDLRGSTDVRPEHVSEAIQYRSLDRNLWQQKVFTEDGRHGPLQDVGRGFI